MQAEKKAKRFTRLEGKELEGEMKSIPWLYDSFIYGGMEKNIRLVDTEVVFGKFPFKSSTDTVGVIFANLYNRFREFKIATVEDEQSSTARPCLVISRPPNF